MEPTTLTAGLALPVGAPAPDFALADGDGRTVRLRDLLGQPVILAFYSPEWDPARAEQLARFNWLARQVPGVDAELLGISMDGLWCQLAFDGHSLRVPLLADRSPLGAVAERYGVRGEEAVFVVDAGGRVAWRHVGRVSSARHAGALLEALRPLADTSARSALFPTTRREFVVTALAAALALAAMPLVSRAESVVDRVPPPRPEPGTAARVTLRVNGRDLPLDIEPRVTLLDALREYAGLTGSKKGCDHGQCGACTVHVNGRRQLSCLTFAVMHQGDEITTVEGLATGDTLHPMQAAFIAHDGFQCGYCTPGQLMSATALLHEPCGSADADVKECMSGNICRCGAYPGIVAAIQDVRGNARG